MIVNKYHLLFVDNTTKKLGSDVINASRLSEAIDRCEAKHSYRIDVIKAGNINKLIELTGHNLDVDNLVTHWLEQQAKAVNVGTCIHRHVDMLIKHNAI